MPAAVIRAFQSFVCSALALVFVLASPTSEAAANLLTLHSTEEYLHHRPNELGRIPVLMYHNIVANDVWRDPSVDPYMYRTYDEFWADLLWLYEQNFYLVGMNDLVSGNLDVPLGKHPVVLTFDDSSSLHFSVIEGDGGRLEIDPNCAVGIMERFHAHYPDFGRGAHFGIVPANKFSWPDHQQDQHFDGKVQWLIENGYEIGNHTLSHPNLAEIDDENFAWTVSGPIIWADDLMGSDHPANASRVLTLPFGIEPKTEDNPTKVNMLEQGFEYEGHHIQLIGILELTGGSSEVPWSKEWDPWSIPRIPVQDDVMQNFMDVHARGEYPYYISDGNLQTVTLPWPVPETQVGKLNTRAIDDVGKVLIKYNPETGKLIKSAHGEALHIYARHDHQSSAIA